MKLSAPIYHLKRRAKILAREENISLNEALTRMAVEEGFASWSLLAAKAASAAPAAKLYSRLHPGDLVLLAARPGQGKTLLGLELAAEAIRAGNQAAFFTLEYTVTEVADRLRSIGSDPAQLAHRLTVDCSDAISAAHITATLDAAPPGTMAVVDYLQLLDQRRENPDLATQVAALKEFAAARGHIIVFISQIDRSFDPSVKPCPDLDDVRLPNPIDLTLFTKACFLNEGEVRFDRVAERALRHGAV